MSRDSKLISEVVGEGSIHNKYFIGTKKSIFHIYYAFNFIRIAIIALLITAGKAASVYAHIIFASCGNQLFIHMITIPIMCFLMFGILAFQPDAPTFAYNSQENWKLKLNCAH